MKPSLLDVNVLIALIDPAHQFHAGAHEWFRLNRHRGWATCPITQNGCLRIMSKPGYPYPGLSPLRMREILSQLTSADGHIFWMDSVSLLDFKRFELERATPGNLTDLYLLGLAATNNARLATFDRAIPWHLVRGCTSDALEVIT